MSIDSSTMCGVPLKVVIASANREVVARIREAFRTCDETQTIAVAADGVEAAQLAAITQAEVVIVDQDLDGDGLYVCGVLSRVVPKARVMLLAAGLNDELVVEAARAGAREVLTHSFQPRELEDAVGRIAEDVKRSVNRDYEMAVNPEMFPRVIAITSGKGGVGCTSVATNLAVLLSASGTGRTVLFDCNPKFPDTTTMLNAFPRHTIADVAGSLTEADLFEQAQVLVMHCALKTVADLDLVVAASAELVAPFPSTDMLAHTILALKKIYRYIVVDAPAQILAERQPAVSSYWRLLVVVNLNDVVLLQNTKRLFEVFGEAVSPEEQAGLIINRFTRNTEFKPKDVQDALKLPVAVTIPEDINMLRACNLGKPVIKEYRNAPSSGALRQLAEKLIETAKLASTGGEFFAKAESAGARS